MNNLAERISALSPEQRALLEKQIQAKRLKSLAALQTITPRRRGDSCPLSLEQEHLWFLSQLEPDSFAYNLGHSHRLVGSLNAAALEQCFNEVIRRHEALRTTFVSTDGRPRQVIAPLLKLPMPVIDLTSIAEIERLAHLQSLISKYSQTPFDLSTGPMIRAALFKLSDTEHRLFMSLHHIVTDRWSFALLWRELMVLYDAFAKGLPSPLPELPIQFPDFALWQREWLEGGVLEKQLSYWKKQLAGAAFVLDLPTDRPRPANQTFIGKRQYRVQNKELWSRLKALCHQENTTLFMMLLAAYYVLLYRYTGQRDICIGTPYANRNRVETEGIIGYLLNMIVLRMQMSGDLTFRELLRRVREMSMEGYANNELPFTKLIEELQPERDLSRNPLFQVTFVFVDFPEPVVNLPNLKLEQVDLDMGSSIVDLMLGVRDQNEPILIFEYNIDLFDHATITRMMIHYETLLESIVSDPHQRLSALSIIPNEERIKLLENETSRAYPRDRCVHELFELQVERTPEAIAVIFEDQELSYTELNARANQLARELRARGVGPEVLVGILMQRSIEMVVALLGVLKAGGGYVPLDLSYPEERLAFIINDAGVSLVLTQQDVTEIAAHSKENLPNLASADNIAYVIYTSGSTGQPKGVQVCQRSLTNCLVSMQREPGLSANDVVLAITNLSFDIATLELLLPLINGARLVIGSRALALDGEQLAAKFDEAEVTMMQATPATWRLLIDSGWQGRKGLKVLSGGEALSRELADALVMRTAAVWNGYGPSETTIYSTLTKVAPQGAVTIGRSIANTQVYVLDEQQNVLPIGCTGELYIGGEGLARGYMRRPELTAEKFFPDPFSGEAGARLYRTGDEVRFLADGALEFLGRIDHQVKLRGYRIELGEIEAVLEQHEAVKACVVLAREDVSGDKRLVAYVVADRESVDEWRQHLKQKLPDYMVPTSFVVLDKLPLTPNGKVDRRALPAPDQSARTQAREFVGPRTPVQEILANIWREILRVKEVGIYDSFFELGGHSLLGTQVISRVRDAFQIELPLRRLFEAPTINQLAACVESAIRSGQLPASFSVTRVLRDDDLRLSFAQQRLWLLDKLEPNNPSYNMATAVRLHGQVQVDALEQALNQLVARHETLRTTFVVRGGELVQVVAEPAAMRVEMIDLSGLDEPTRGDDLARAMKAEAQRPFVLASESLLRVKVIRLGDEEHVLLITMHHIISDAWSMEIFIRELAKLYEASANGETAALPELPVQYADYAAAQRRWLSGDVLDAHLTYWEKQLGGELPVLDLPLDHVRPPVQTFRSERRRLRLSKETTEDLKKLSRSEGATTFMTLLAAFKALLHYYSAQEDIIVGTPIAGRNHAQVESLIGCFLNTLVLRTDLSGNPSFTELLGRVKHVALGAYAHQELPFELLLERLKPVRDLSKTPLFQVMFNLLNVPESQIELAGLTLETMATPDVGAKFDLTVYAFEEEESLRFTFVYNADLFEGTTITQMVECFQVLLTAIARHPEQPLATLLREVKEESWQPARQRSIVNRDETFVEFPRTEIEQSIPARFSRQVQRYGDKTAVKTKQHEWSYRELDRRANQIAHTLLAQRGVGEDRIALLFDHDAPMIAAMLGVLKAGKTYVPLDPAYPRARTEYMLADSQAAAILTNKQNLALAQELATIPILNIDDLDADVPEVTLSIAPDAIAYLLYTSGSTGQPKGVMQDHRNVLHHIRTYTNALCLSSADKLLLLASYSFDAAVMDIYGALLNGAGLYPVNLRSEGFRGLAAWLNDQQVSVYHSTPTVYRYFLGTLKDEERLENVRLVVLGGEEARRHDVNAFQTHFSKGSVLVNGLGPTESTLALQYFLGHGEELAREAVPIGYAVADTEVRLVNDAGDEVLGYGPGEIEIRSEHIARGYWMKPELTEAAFKEHGRSYRTGDMSRRLWDGSLEYLGRKDHQVKVRGMRVELGEIEAELMQCEGVSSVVVVAREAQRGEKQLACYVTGNKNADELRSYLKKRLPDYMVPASFMVMDELPLTPNGKLDRRALQDLVVEGEEGEYLAPSTPAERIVAEVWAEVLRRERVGRSDNFFEIGGHSLLATQVITRVHETFEVEMPLRSLFEHPTLAEFVIAIEAKVVESVEALTEEEALALL